ncbi:MAG: T9SS type A sorting domain-containing protein [Cyclobacteriaceae bacterium]|nr:T9SS type A sorting domain-containing protein [Cyclobacteriaceae bacterium]MDH5250330.1 T9SS type A sorting domain-containing protein [Cyclobacteriaceae bacterium]
MIKALSYGCIYLGLLMVAGLTNIYAQTCTITGPGPVIWNNASPPACNEGGTTTGKSIIVIPAGVTLEFDSNGDTWTGTRIDVYGTLDVSFNVTINSSVSVYNGGLVNLLAKLSLGSAAGCGYTMIIYTGGTVDVSIASDRLSVCGTELMKGGISPPACNDCSGTNSGACPLEPPPFTRPYCEPTNGFQGPLGYSESGYDGTLPVKLLYFTATLEDETVLLKWATTMEENFQKFIIERSQTGVDFESIGEVDGAGQDIFNMETPYAFVDSAPLLGFNYYRLMALDLDGNIEYFDVRVVKLSGTKQLSVYPNPSDGKSISFDINFNPSDEARISLINNLGIELLRQPVKDFKNQLVFDNDLSPGVYILKYLSRDFESNTRVMVTH